MKIITKTNLHLWLLTGRYDGFRSAALNAGVHFKSGAPPANVTAVRRILKLDDTRTDFYVLGALAATRASAPFLRDLPDDGCLAFSGDLVPLPPTSVVGAVAISPDAMRMFTVSGRIAGSKHFTSLQIRKHGDNVTVTDDNGVTFFAQYTISGSTLSIPDLKELGIDARFVVDGWADGQAFTVYVAQSHYPYAQFADAIADSSVAVQLMLEEGTMEAFAASSRPIHKVGAAACAIMRRMAKLLRLNEIELVIEIPDADSGQGDGNIYDSQLALDGLPIFYGGAPVTYTEPT